GQCIHQGDMALKVVNAKTIDAVVAMIPLSPENFTGDTTGRFFAVEKPGLDVSHMGGNDEILTEVLVIFLTWWNFICRHFCMSAFPKAVTINKPSYYVTTQCFRKGRRLAPT